MINYLLNINILVKSDIIEKKLFNLYILTIDYYWPIESSIPIVWIFFELNRLSIFISLFINLNCTKNKSYGKNCNMSKVDIKVSWIEEMPSTNLNYIKSKSYNDICSKNHCNINDKIGI